MSANSGIVGATTHVTKHTTTLPDGRQSVKTTTKTSYPDGRTQVQTREDIQAPPMPQPRSQQSVVKREISTNPDGSQRVKTTTTTTHPDGQRSVSVKAETVRPPPHGSNSDGAAEASSSGQQASSSALTAPPPPAAGNENAAASAPPSAPEPLPPPTMAVPPPSAPLAPPRYGGASAAGGGGYADAGANQSSVPAAPAAVAVPIPFDDDGNMEMVAAQAVPATASNYSSLSQSSAAARSSHSAPAAASGSRSSNSSGTTQPVQIPVSLPPGPIGATFRGNPGEFPKIASVSPNSPLWPESVGMVVASLLLPGNQAVSGKVGTSELVRFLRHHANEEGRVLVLETTPQAAPPPPPPPTTRPNQLSIPLPPGPLGATFRGNPGEFPRVASVSVDSPLFGQVQSADGNDDGVVGMVVASLLLPGNVAVSGTVGTSTLVRHLREHSGGEGRVLVLERPKEGQDPTNITDSANSSAGAAAVGSSTHARASAQSSSSGEHKDMSFGEYYCNKRCGWIAVAVVLAIIAIIVGAVSEKEVACDQLCYEDEDCCVLSDYFCGGTEEEPACYCSRPSGGWYCGEEEASSKMKVGYVVPLVFAIIGFIAVGAYLSCMACQDFKSWEEERVTN